jgi:hypothetical protein
MLGIKLAVLLDLTDSSSFAFYIFFSSREFIPPPEDDPDDDMGDATPSSSSLSLFCPFYTTDITCILPTGATGGMLSEKLICFLN